MSISPTLRLLLRGCGCLLILFACTILVCTGSFVAIVFLT